MITLKQIISVVIFLIFLDLLLLLHVPIIDVVQIAGLIVAIYVFFQNVRIHQTNLIHDMVKTEMKTWKDVKEDKTNSSIFNYYEYLAYLINHNKINFKEAIILWGPNLKEMYARFEKKYSTTRTELPTFIKSERFSKYIKKNPLVRKI